MAHFLCHLGAHILEPFCSISILPKTCQTHFILDVFLVAVSLALNILLFRTKYQTPLLGKIALLLATLCFGAFTYFAFLMPENGLPPVLFY